MFSNFTNNNRNNMFQHNLISHICDLHIFPKVRNVMKDCGLTIGRVAWLDSERNIGSAWGRTITDFTLVAKLPDGIHKEVSIIRDGTNFEDKIKKISLESVKVPVRVGEGDELNIITLRKYLSDISKYVPCSDQHVYDCNLLEELEGRSGDAEMLISAQASVLPVMDDEKIDFHIRVDTYGRNVLVIMVSKFGTSAQFVSGRGDLYVNLEGKKGEFNLESFRANRARDASKPQGRVKSHKELSERELLDNYFMMVQIPLKSPPRVRLTDGWHPNYFGDDEVNYGGEESYNLSASNFSKVPPGMSSFPNLETDLFSSFSACSHSASVTRGVHFEERTEKKGMDFGFLGITDTGEEFPELPQKMDRDVKAPIRITLLPFRTTNVTNINSEEALAIKEQLVDSLAKLEGEMTNIHNVAFDSMIAAKEAYDGSAIEFPKSEIGSFPTIGGDFSGFLNQ